MLTADSYRNVLEEILRNEVLVPSPDENTANDNPDLWKALYSFKLGVSKPDLDQIVDRLQSLGVLHVWNMSIVPYQDNDGTFLVRENDGAAAFDESQSIVEYTVASVVTLREEIRRIEELNGEDLSDVFESEASWGDITIRFVGDNSVTIIRAGEDGAKDTDYEGMGFADQRNHAPKQAWALLRLLARKGGLLSWQNNQELDLQGLDRIKQQKRALKEGLQAYFKIESDPFFNYREERGYKLRFNIEMAEG